jgi:hypothetical protein
MIVGRLIQNQGLLIMLISYWIVPPDKHPIFHGLPPALLEAVVSLDPASTVGIPRSLAREGG